VSRKIGRGLWLLAGLVTMLLLAATVGLADRSRTQAIVGESLYLVDRGGAVKLYQAPSQDSETVAALVRGSQVIVLGLIEKEDQTWYLVQKGEMTAGWIPASGASRDPP